jgi:DinB superfamily
MEHRTFTRTQRLAAELEAVNNSIEDAVANATAEQWRHVTESEGWPFAVVAHHVAEVQRFGAGAITGLSADDFEPMAITGADIDANNARHAEQFANVSKAETLDALRENGALLVSRVRSLNDDQLTRVLVLFDGQPLTAEQIVSLANIAHFREHLDSLRHTLDG